MGRFVDLKKNDFVGRDAALQEKQDGPALNLVLLDIDAADADVINDEPVFKDGKVVGWVTSGGYAHHVGKSVALGYVPAEIASNGGDFEVEVMGQMRPAQLLKELPFDPNGERMRA